MEEDLDEKAKRVRELLSSFYKSDDSDSSELDGVGEGRRDTLQQINTTQFEPERYMASLLRKMNLQSLLKKHVEMAAEIKNLDSDMQMLVYENYSKFISATETIKVMKDNVSGMESNMQQLLDKITAVRTKSDSINASLFERREKIEELNGTRGLLRKVEFVFDLPKRLRQCIQTDDYAFAVRSYTGALPVFKDYGNSSFQACKAECEEIMDTIAKDLEARVLADSEPLEKRVQAVALLKDLQFPTDSLVDTFLENNMEQLLHSSSQRRDSVDGPQNFIASFAETASTFRSLFPSNEDRLKEAVKGLAGRYFSIAQSTLLQPETGAMSAVTLVASLKSISSDVARMHEAMPEAGFYDTAAKTVESVVMGHVHQLFHGLYKQVTGVLMELYAPVKQPQNERQQPLALGLEKCKQTIVNGGLDVLRDLTHLLDHSVDLMTSWREDFVDLVQGGFQEFFVSFLNHCMGLASRSGDGEAQAGSRDPSPSSGFVLLLSQLFTFIEQEGVPKITEAVGNSFVGGSMTDRPAFVPSEICRAYRAAGEKLLYLYIDVQSRKISAIICKSITTPNWLQYKEPRDVRMFTDLVLDEVKQMVGDAKEVLPPGKSHRRSDSAGSYGSYRSNNSRSSSNMVHRGKSRLLERDVAKLFKQRIEIFTKAEMTQASVTSLVVKIALKSFQEYVRAETFGRCGFQQIQVDTHYLRDPLRKVVDDEDVVDFLLDEVCAAAAERCIDPVPLDQVVIDKLTQTKREKLLERDAAMVFI